MKPIGEIFSKTNQTFKENWISALVVSFVFFLIYFVALFAVVFFFGNPYFIIANSGSVGGVAIKLLIASGAILLVSIPLIWSYRTMFLSHIRGGKLSFVQLFNGYNDAWRIVWGYILQFFCFMAFVLLLGVIALIVRKLFDNDPMAVVLMAIPIYLVYVAGVIYIYLSLCLFDYIIFDDEDISAFDALKRSVQLMKGHKLQLFFTILLIDLAAVLAMLIPVIIIALAIDQESKFLVIFSAVVVIVETLAFMSYSGMLMAHFYESVIDEENGGAEPIAERTTGTINSADFEEKQF